MHTKKKFITAAVLLSVFASAAVCAFPVSADSAEWFKIDGKHYCNDENGELYRGEVQINGIWYLFAPNGALQTGWQTVNGNRYYYDAHGKAVFGWLDWRGERYYIDKQYGKINYTSNAPFPDAPEQKAYFDEYGIAYRGWFSKTDDSSRYYADENGVLAAGTVTIDGVPYVFDENYNYQKTGLQKCADGIIRYYDSETGEMQTGWIETYSGSYRYADTERGVLIGEQSVDGIPYLFDEDGILQSGFQTLSDGTTRYYTGEPEEIQIGWMNYAWHSGVYYFDKNGVMAVGRNIEIGGRRYSFSNQRNEEDADYNPDYPLYGSMITGFDETENGTYYYKEYGEIGEDYGAMLTGWQEIDWEKYYFSADGLMASGMKTIDENLYHFSDDGKMQTGWAEDGNKRYYFDTESGAAVTGKYDIEDKSYYFDEDYVMQSGGLYTNQAGKKYFLGDDGVMTFGVVMLDEKPYLFGDDGTMQFGFASCMGKPYYCNADGTITKGAFTNSGKKYIVGDDYALLTCWQVIDGKEYFFGWDGAMVTGTTEINGYTYKFNKSGVYQGADFGYTDVEDKLVQKAEKSLADEPLRTITIWDNGKKFCTTRTSFPTKKYSLIPEFELTDDDIHTIERFAAEHFAPSMTLTQKLWITLQWIHKQVTYATDYPPSVYMTTYVDTIFNNKLGQCLQYNGAMASVLAYFGFDVYLCKGCTKSGNQHFWTEVLIDGKRYYVETGNFGKNGKWQHFFQLVNN